MADDTILYDKLLEVVKKRRNNRKFKSDPIPEGYIEKIIEVARWAPSGFHTQPWEFVAITREDIRERIVGLLDRKSPPIRNPDDKDDIPGASFRDAPAFIFALCDYRAYVGLPGNLEKDNPLVANIFCSSMASTFLLMHLAAASLGLSSQWYSYYSPCVINDCKCILQQHPLAFHPSGIRPREVPLLNIKSETL